MFGVRDEGPVRWLTIDNPERRNAIPFGGWARLAKLIDEFAASWARVLVLTGAGEDFCSGADVGGAMIEGTAAGAYDAMAEVSAAAAALHRTPKPTVAAVDGVAVGAGMNLALGCDIVIASERARFSEIFVKRGLTLDFGGTWLLPRLAGIARAKELALTGRLFGAGEALEYGLVTAVVPHEDLAATAAEKAAELAAGAPLAQRFIKEGLDRAFEMSFGEALSYEQRAQTILFTSEDLAEGVSAFLQKRPPDFKGR
jgi:2-(1,2-epoxy-1,2-dihydrophenyl)acetyl-CoA isomerase